jgi:hypothetical protein
MLYTSRVIEWLVHGELEWMWKEDKWSNLRYSTGILLEELQEIAKS